MEVDMGDTASNHWAPRATIPQRIRKRRKRHIIDTSTTQQEFDNLIMTVFDKRQSDGVEDSLNMT